MRAEPNRIAGACGVGAAALHVAGAMCLWNVQGAFRPDSLDRWFYAAQQHSVATAWSAWCFTLGAVLLVPWAMGLARALGPYAWPGAGLVTVAALVNATSSLLPFVVVTHLPHGEVVIGQTLLAVALTADAVFHLVWGVALVLLSLAMARALNFKMWLSGWGLLAGILAMGVVGQAWSPTGADFGLLAGPVWVAWLVSASLALHALPFVRPASVEDAVDRPRRREQLPFVPRPTAMSAK